MGVACAVNQAWDASPTPFFVKLDNDMVVLDKPWLGPLKKVASLPFVGAVAYEVYNANGDLLELPSGRTIHA